MVMKLGLPNHLLKTLNLITSAKPLLPHKVAYSQVSGITTWTYLGGILLKLGFPEAEAEIEFGMQDVFRI